MKILDCRGLECPKPVIITKKELDSMESGEIEVIVDNEAAKENVSKLAINQGFLVSTAQAEKLYHITIKKENNSCKLMNFENEKNIVILISSDKFGVGEDKLGIALMKSYIYAISESDVVPTSILFANSGVKLTTEGSDVIESLKVIKNKGTEILSCGTCLDFYSLKEKLIIGEVTNMYTIVEKMTNASNSISI